MTEPPVFYHAPRPKRAERNKRPFQVDPTKHLAYAAAVAVKFGARGDIPDSWQYAEAVVGLVRAAKDYVGGGPARFVTLAYRYMVGEILKSMRIARNPNRLPPARVGRLGDWQPATMDGDSPWDVEALPAWLRQLPERHRRITEAWYFRDVKMGDIATQEGLTRQRVHAVLNESLDYLRRAAGLDPSSIKTPRRKPVKTLLPA
jgi:RNA polymerase sigma factor (sigma-70 family)